jgi:23S rRNA pseudouridine1911/1915/1917 synthase
MSQPDDVNYEDSFDETQDENSELYEHFRIEVDKGQSLLRVDKFLMNRLESISRNKIQQAAKAGNIHVNSIVVKSNYKVKPGDIVAVVLSYPPREVEIVPQPIPLDIVYEDDFLIVINKQSNLVVHPAHGNYSGTLLNGLAYYFAQTNQKIENGFGYLVHRIDKDTTGLLMIAKDELSQQRISRQFFEHSIHRKYNALVWGDFESDTGTIIGHIGRSYKDRRVMTVFPDGAYGKDAVTHYRVLERFGYVSLVECKLETGRTHQIRVHFQYIGHPVFNDPWYGGNVILKGTTFTKYKQFIDNCFKIVSRHALHAVSLGFKHPETGEDVYLESQLPVDMQTVIQKWKTYVASRNPDN